MKIRLVGTRANLITFTQKGKNYYYTNFENNIISNGREFSAIPINVGTIRASTSEVRAEVDIEINVEHKLADLINFSDSENKIIAVIEECYTNTPNQTDFIYSGIVADNITNDFITKITLKPMNHDFDSSTNVYTFMNTCNKTVGFYPCSVNLDNFIFTAEVLDILQNGLVITLSRTVPQDFTAQGLENYLQMGAMKRNDKMVTIIESTNSLTSSNIRLKNKMQNLKIGEVIELIPGCDGRSITCKNKFDNFKDYLGFVDRPNQNAFKKLK